MDFIEKARIMDSPRINRALARLSSEVVEENHGAGDLFLVGIRRRGVPLAERMADKIADVLFTGRTIRAALDQLIDFGRPRRVQLAVLIDRGKEHRELPIQADYIGKLVPTKKSEIIKVMLQEFDEEEGVVIVERPATETT